MFYVLYVASKGDCGMKQKVLINKTTIYIIFLVFLYPLLAPKVVNFKVTMKSKLSIPVF